MTDGGVYPSPAGDGYDDDVYAIAYRDVEGRSAERGVSRFTLLFAPAAVVLLAGLLWWWSTSGPDPVSDLVTTESSPTSAAADDIETGSIPQTAATPAVAATTTPAGRVDNPDQSSVASTSGVPAADAVRTTDRVVQEPPTSVTTATTDPILANIIDADTPIVLAYRDDAVGVYGTAPSVDARYVIEELARDYGGGSVAVDSFIDVDADAATTFAVSIIDVDAVRFSEGSTRIDANQRAEYDRIADLMVDYPDTQVTVVGHTDSRGDAAANLALSEQRAESGRQYLIDAGIDPQRVSIRAAGESEPLADEDDSVGLELNRRTEFVVTGLFD